MKPDEALEQIAKIVGPTMPEDPGGTPMEFHHRDLVEAINQVIEQARQTMDEHEENILEEANRIVGIGRRRSLRYGHPAENFTHTAALWSAAFGWEVDATRVAMAQVLLKVSRECNSHTRDNLTDIAGYARTLEMVHEYFEDQAGIAEAQKAIQEHVTPPGPRRSPGKLDNDPQG